MNTSRLFLVNLLIMGLMPVISNAADETILMEAKGSHDNLKASCLERASNGECTSLEMVAEFFVAKPSRALLKTPAEIQNYLKSIRNFKNSLIQFPVRPAFNMFMAAVDRGYNDPPVALLEAIAIGPFDIITAPEQLVAYGISIAVVKQKVHKTEKNLESFIRNGSQVIQPVQYKNMTTFDDLVDKVYSVNTP